MAKKSPTTKSKKHRQAPAEWQDAVDASAANDPADENDGTGIVYENGTPYVIEKLTLEEQAAAGHRLGELNIELRELELDGARTATLQRKNVKALKKKIADLSQEAFDGLRKASTQKNLPHTEPGKPEPQAEA
jgi:hypothetical protein